MPQYETLTCSLIRDYIKLFPEAKQYLPIDKELDKVPKQWLVNVVYSVLKDPFYHWVKAKIEERNEKVTTEKNLLIEMDPEVAKAF